MRSSRRCLLGSRDDLLLQLREQIFGPRLESVVKCPKCSESLEINLDIHELRAGSESGDNPAAEWTNGDLSVRFRVPTGGDAGAGDKHREPRGY